MLKQIKLKENLNLFIQISISILIFLIMIFARPAVGIEILGFRVGEYLILFGLVISVTFLFLPKKYAEILYFNDFQFYSHKLIIFSFFLVGFFTNANFLSTYTFKSSSYIWTLSFLIFGYIYNLQSKISSSLFFLPFLFIPFLNYLFSSGNYPNIFIDFFKIYSDKFQFLKASDIFLGYVVVNFLMKYFIKSQNRRFFYFIITSALLLPLLLFASRGSFVGLIIYMIFEIFYSRRYILNNKLRVSVYFLVSLIFFSFSVLRIDRSELARPSVEDLIEIYTEEGGIEGISNSLFELADEKDTVNVIFSFYWHYGRLESTDPTTNWRLDIWQDAVYYMSDNDILITGHGYNEIFPIMLDPTAPGRLGRDGMNEHVHNYLVNIFARGGIFQLFLFIFFHLSLIKYWKDKNSNYQILMFIVPCFFVSMLDITMEGVQFPLIYFSFLYYFLKNSTKVKVVELYG